MSKILGFQNFLPLSYQFKVFGLFSLLLFLSIFFLLAPQWWYSSLHFSSIFKSAILKLLLLLREGFVLHELIACACLREEILDLASTMNFLGEAIPLLGCRSVVKVKFVDWSFDRSFWFVLSRSWSYLWFNLKSSDVMLITYSSLWLFSVVASSVGCLLKYSVNAKCFPAVCLFRISKCARLSNHLVGRALCCQYARLPLINGSKAWWFVYRCTTLLFKKKRSFSNLHTTARSCNSPIE